MRAVRSSTARSGQLYTLKIDMHVLSPGLGRWLIVPDRHPHGRSCPGTIKPCGLPERYVLALDALLFLDFDPPTENSGPSLIRHVPGSPQPPYPRTPGTPFLLSAPSGAL
ncbi:hypothetical protein FRC12_015475 [Ceratobasidium sp. 428]|nr:hypothetical protein FRC12_015475 [Ceratobasidium sp. 428]